MMSKERVGVVRFPGTNCDRDVFEAVEACGHKAQWLWHQDRFTVSDFDRIVIPGGFSYGDYLRCGALAAKAPVMTSLHEAANQGLPILGICNGFQILCESGLLPGALIRNQSLRFVDRWVNLNLKNANRHWAGSTAKVRLPVAHGEGRFYIDDDGMKRLQDQNQIWWTYSENPNGSLADIAGVTSEKGNVAALMPHPERAMVEWMGGRDGLAFFQGGLA